MNNKTWTLVAVLALALAFVPGAAAQSDDASNANECNGLVDVNCEADDTPCTLWVGEPHVRPNCVVG